jgi:hypothetical protein
MVGALASAGIEMEEKVDRLRQDEHSVTHRDIDLLDYYYCASARQPQELTWKLPSFTGPVSNVYRDYYRAYNIESRFVFVGNAGCDVLLRLTCRLPGTEDSEDKIFVEINGKRLAEEKVGAKWETREMVIGGEMVQDGLNAVIIHWPLPQLLGENAIEEAADSLVNGNLPEFFPVFGEIHSLVASAGGAERRRYDLAPAGHV